MAWTVTRYPTVFGDKRAIGLKLVADSAEANITTGLGVIEWYSSGALTSMATGFTDIRINVNSSGTAAQGTIGASGFASGDELYLTVYGR